MLIDSIVFGRGGIPKVYIKCKYLCYNKVNEQLIRFQLEFNGLSELLIAFPEHLAT